MKHSLFFFPLAAVLAMPLVAEDAATFKLTSTDVVNGQLGKVSYSENAGGKGASPQLSWTGFPSQTKSFVVTVFDVDAPTPSGLWHWAVKDIPVAVTSLGTGAGAPGGQAMPAKAVTLPNDIRLPFFIGAEPPVGQKHRYVITVYALDVETLAIPADSTPAFLSLNVLGHTLGKASLTAVGQR